MSKPGTPTLRLIAATDSHFAALAATINLIIETLSAFGDMVTNLAREVGIEGKVGGLARVPGAYFFLGQDGVMCHHPAYDFDDGLLDVAVDVFVAIIADRLGST